MKHHMLFASMCAAAMLAGCAHEASPPPPADASAATVCRDGRYWTEKGGCAGHGGIDHRASAAKADESRDKQAAAEKSAGAPGEVWAMPMAKTYVCRTDADYGKAREGQYMTEAQAQAKGFRPAHGSCAH